jgi:Putative peptidoglycan binding domain
MHFANPGARSSSVAQRSHFSATSNRSRTSTNTHLAQAARRPTLNGRADHIAERHDAANWHREWDRRHAHFFHNRFFVFDDGFWFGLDSGFFPWDYYPYYAYDYYPYDYYPGYYTDVEPYYYDEGVYSDAPMHDPAVNAVQTKLTRLGYYKGPVDGVFGPTTRDAVAKYQMAKHLDVSGSLSPNTLQSLGLPPATPG